MRSSKLALFPLLLIASGALVGACAAPTESDTANDGQDVTGGVRGVDSPVVFIFTSDKPDA